MKEAWPPQSYIYYKSPEHNIKIKNKFEMLVAVQEDMMLDKLATQIRGILIESAQSLLRMKGHKEHRYVMRQNQTS